MKVLVINCGSSSLKYQVLEMDTETLLCKGLVERIGINGSQIKHEKIGSEKFVLQTPMKNHKEAIGHVMDALVDPEHGVVSSMGEIGAVGHRVVHAGEKYATSVVINEDVIKVLEECTDLAPLHNPANILGIRACQEMMPGVPMVGVFDTAFHQTMPKEAYLYPIPYKYYEKYRVRRYGFHGTSHRYVSKRVAELMGKDIRDLKIITCHLGNGASLAAIDHGRVIDTSMGFTPLAGVAMGTRSGNIDPSIITYLAAHEGKTADQILNELNKESGIQGLSGVSSDFRDVESAANEGNERAKIAEDVFVHRVKSYLGAYFLLLNGADAIVFTAGVGENDKNMRARICSRMENLGVKICPERNDVRGKEALISTDDSKVQVWTIPTNEELTIARDTVELVG